MEIRPILSTLGRHKTAALLIVLQIALTCAIVCNALFLIGNRLERMQRPSGIAENELVRIQIAGIGRGENADSRTRADLAALKAIPGVKAASTVNEITFDGSSWNSGVKLTADQTHESLNATVYLADEGFSDTVGLRLVEGRGFHADEFLSWEAINQSKEPVQIPVAIITRTMADKLFPEGHALGSNFYSWGDDQPTRIIGIVDHLARPNEFTNPAGYEYSMIFPVRVPHTLGGRYLLRTDPARRAEVLKAAVVALQANDPNRIILKQDTLTDMRAAFYKQDRVMAWMLVLVIVLLLLVTALGIVGLVSFWVQQRNAPDRRAPRAGRDPRADPALLPDREFPAGDAGHRARHGAGLRAEPAADGQGRTATTALPLPALRRAGVVAARPACSAVAGAARGCRAAGNRHAQCLILA